MALQGNLHDMTVADLIQHTCQDRKTAQLTINHRGQDAQLFFKDGNVVHATLGDVQGEEVVYDVLGWEEGTFALQADVATPLTSIQRSWSGLLMNGARLLDERSANDADGLHEPGELTSDFNSTQENLSMAPAGTPKKKSELLADALTSIMSESAELESCAVVGTDGLVLASIVTGKLDEGRFGAQAAAFYGICIRASSQLARGIPYQAVIQADNGNIVAYAVNASTLFVATTPKDGVLGMIFREAAEAARQIAQIV